MRLIVCAALVCAVAASAETWRGLTVAPEHRCSPYRAGDYSYPQMEGLYSQYSTEWTLLKFVDMLMQC